MFELNDKERRFVAAVMVSAFVALFLVASYVSYATRIDSASSFPHNIGNRVKFTATFNGVTKPGAIIALGDTSLVMKTRATGRFDWPEIGDTLSVAGRLERGSAYSGESGFVLRDATWTINRQFKNNESGEP